MLPMSGGKNGLWQVPAQLECALTHLSVRRVQHSLTIGTFSGWTDIFLAAFLRRFAPDPSAYSHLTVDIIGATIQPCVQVHGFRWQCVRVWVEYGVEGESWSMPDCAAGDHASAQHFAFGARRPTARAHAVQSAVYARQCRPPVHESHHVARGLLSAAPCR